MKSMVRFRVALPFTSIHRISHGRHQVVDPEVGRIHHFRVPLQPLDPPIPFTVDDPIGMPATRRTR